MTPQPEKAQLSLQQFGQVLVRLEEALAVSAENNSLARDGTIQRFEFCVELCWKALKRYLLEEGQTVTSPKETLKQAYQNRWIDDEALWLAMKHYGWR